MRIERLTFKERDTGWELAPMEFFPGVTLLVGASGVGKTRILRAIHTLQAIAENRREGFSVSGVEWDLLFSVGEGRQFHWSGRYSGINDLPAAGSANGIGEYDEDFGAWPRILSEKLTENGRPLIERNADTIRFDGNLTPKLSPYTSCLSLLSHEEKIAPAHQAWANMLRPNDDPEDTQSGYIHDFSAYYGKLPTFEAIRDSHLRTQHKLALVCKNAPEVLLRILDDYREIFPTVEQLRVRIESVATTVRVRGSSHREELTRERPTIDLKENGIWITQERISSGMWRTLMHLARMVLWPDGTVVLFDEFENSLGINCLDMVTDSLNSNSRRLQFILTSHHPYVIHNIYWKQWKILRRKGAVVTAHAPEELGFDIRSKHDAFLKLINLEEYREGIAVP